MADPVIFQVFEGMIEVQYAYWSNNNNAALPDDQQGVLVYGAVNSDNPLYFHIRLQDLFVKSNYQWLIQKNAVIHIDLYSIHHTMYRQLQEKEDFDKLGDYINLLHSFSLNLTDNKKVAIDENAPVSKYELEDTVTDFNAKPFSAYLTKVPGRNATSALNAFDFDICFEFKPDEELKKKLFSEAALRKNVFAWVWVAHKKSKEEYTASFNIDITNPAKRFEFLKKPDKNFFGAIDILFAPLTKAKRYSRAQLYMNKFSDGFPYDEQTLNYIEMNNCLPFKSLAVGTQMGPTGICSMDTHYFDRYVQDHRSHSSTFLVDGVPSLHCKLDTDKNFKPDFAADRGVVLHGLESKLNEFYSRGDNRFFFRENSVSHWINSLEKKFSGSTAVNGMDTIHHKGYYPFSNGKLELLSHDFIKNYRSQSDIIKRFAGPDRFVEQQVIDLKEFESIHIAPSGEVKSSDGSFHVKCGKGFPGNDRFIDTIHTKITFDKDPDTWQAHAVAHRPLVVTFELERDLTADELDVLKNNPLKLLFWIGKPEKKTYVEFPLTIDYTNASTKGKHAVLLYLVTNDVKFDICISEDGVAALENYQLRDGTPMRMFSCSCELLKEFRYYTPENSGLFDSNPIIIVDDYQTDEIKENALAKIRKEYGTGIRNSSIKFLLGFVPGIVGKTAGIGWDLLSEWDSKGSVSDKTAIDTADKGLKLLLTDILKKKDPDSLLNYNKFENTFKIMKFAEQLISITSKYIESSTLVSSPMFDGAGFGGKPQADSLYLLAVGSNLFKVDPAALTSTKTATSGEIAFFCNREIIRQGKQPFNYQLGVTGGLLARHAVSATDSLSSFRVDYQQKLINFKENFNKETAVTLPEYLKKLASTVPGAGFSDTLKKVGANKALTSYFDSNGIAQKFLKGLTNATNLTEDEKVVLTTFLNLVMYIDASFAYCPACEKVVSLSWGWCPYHATREMLGLQDMDGDGKFNKEFVRYLKDPKRINPTNPKLTDLIDNELVGNNANRLLVHWTEFIIGS